MSLADAIVASTPAAAAAPSERKERAKTGASPATSAATNSNDRPRNSSPAFQAYEDKKKGCDARIADIRARIDAVRNGYSMAGGENLSEKNRKLRAELIEKVKALRGELKVLEDERRSLSNQFNETLESLKKKNADVSAAKEKMSFKSTAEIDARILEIESTLESGRFTLSEERQMLQEVTKLRKMRKALENMDGTSGNDISSLRFRLDQIKLRQGDIEGLITGKRDEINAVNAEIDAVNGIQATEKSKRADSKTEIEGLKKELDLEYAKKKAAWDEYLQVKAAKEAAYHRMIARKEEQARVSAIEGEIDELERKLGHLTTESVIDKKWNECTNLINFFQPFLASQDSTESKTKACPPAARVRSTTVDLSKVQVLKKADDCYFVPSKASKKQQKPAAAVSEESNAELTKLPFHILAALTDMSLPMPKSVEKDLPDLLSILQARRNDLQSHRDASLAAMEEKRNSIIKEIEALRAKIESKDEQITAAAVKKAEKAAAVAGTVEPTESESEPEPVVPGTEVVEPVEPEPEN